MKKYFIYIQVLILSMVTVSCEDYLDVNTDPNNPTEVTPDLVLPTGQNYTAQYVSRDRGLNHLGNMFMYNWSQAAGFSWYNDEFLYLVTSSFYDQLFDDSYLRGLKQYQILTQLGPEFDNYKAIGMIMKAYHYQILVDLYGDVPYVEALGRSALATPAYNDAQEIYDDLIIQLSDAIQIIDAAAADAASVKPAGDDIMFGGNMTMWKQFANTVKIRILVRESDIAAKQAYITTEIAVIVAEGSGFIGGDVEVNPGYLNEEGKQNPYWNGFGASVDGTVTLTNDATCATQYVLDQYGVRNDPRIDFAFERPATGHLGVEQGITVDAAFSATFVSNIGPGITTDATMSTIIFTEAENNFNLAEAAFKGLYGGGTPDALYDAAVLASFTTLGSTGYGPYIALNSYASAANKLEAIITEKWVALNGINAEQTWFDYSRTGFPSGLPISALASTPDRPVRLFYPSSELSGNAVNVPTQKNAFNDKIFWGN